MQDQANDNPDLRCRAHVAMSRAWTIVQDVSAGTLHMRERGKEYLPQFPAEMIESWRDRVKSATLFNAYRRTINGLVGMVFKKNPSFSDDVPDVIKKHAENIDLAGTHFDVFTKEVFKDAFEGHSFILVDMQPPLGAGATLADEIKQGRRPYWVRYKACEAVNFRSVVINGQTMIGQITFEEKTNIPSGKYGEQEVLQYRTFRLAPYLDDVTLETKYRVEWELNRKVTDNEGKTSFELVGSGTFRQPCIPVAVVYGNKTGFLTSTPPLLDLALTNIKYWQKRSDYDHSLHIAGIPIPVGVGIPEDFNMAVVGTDYMVRVPENGDLKYCEPTGASLKAAREDLQDVRGEMAALGLSVLAARPSSGKATATETLIDFTQESSELATIVRSLSDAIELCLGFHARYINAQSGGSVNLGAEFKNLTLTADQLRVYAQMQADGQLTLQMLWEIMKRGDALPDDFNAADELVRLYGKGAEGKSAVELATEAEKRAGGDKNPGGSADDLPDNEKE